ATGIELAEQPVLDELGNPVLDAEGQPVTVEVNPIPEGSRMAVSESEQTKFGQLQAADLAGYEASVRVLLGQIQAVSTLPSAYLGVMTDQPPSADALRASESSLVARAEARQQTFGRAWEQVAKLMIAVRDGRDPNLIDDIRVHWADAATRSVAQEADAVVKLYQAGLLPAAYALGKLGYSDDEIAKVNSARSAAPMPAVA
ncbi:MAG: phage portal protein, partial [Dietzia sp.]|nr:phage portal protein [Dietzia sp.]